MYNKIVCALVFLYLATVSILCYFRLQKIEKSNIELFGEICYNRGYLDAKRGLKAKSQVRVKEIINKANGE